MKKTMLTLSFFLLCISFASAQPDWRDKLSKDLVEYRNGKMICEEYGICTLEVEGYEPVSVQVKLHSEAPEGGIISRDNFVKLSADLHTMILLKAISEGPQIPMSQILNAFNYKELKSIIGTADLELNLYMTNEGVQIEIINTVLDNKTRMVQTWEEVYGN